MNGQSSTTRRPRIDELPELEALDYEVFGEISYNTLVWQQFYDLAGSLLFVAIADGRLAGYSLVLPSAVRGEGWFMALGVRANYRRQAFGRSPSKAVLHEAKVVGITSVRLTVGNENRAAKDLYADLGFAFESEESDYFGPGQHRIIMRNAAI
jgi:ribosomal protein S18 acetylase RimI-like enzyme